MIKSHQISKSLWACINLYQPALKQRPFDGTPPLSRAFAGKQRGVDTASEQVGRLNYDEHRYPIIWKFPWWYPNSWRVHNWKPMDDFGTPILGNHVWKLPNEVKKCGIQIHPRINTIPKSSNMYGCYEETLRSHGPCSGNWAWHIECDLWNGYICYIPLAIPHRFVSTWNTFLGNVIWVTLW